MTDWNQWWNSGSQGPMTSWNPNQPMSADEEAFWNAPDTSSDWQSGMLSDVGYGSDFGSGGDIFADIGG
jgi:hypothetical protein